MRKWMVSGVGLWLALLWAGAAQPGAWGAPQEKPAYTLAEYNAYNACVAEKAAPLRVRCFDDFVAKYPSSTLLIYVYRNYYNTYNELKNYPKVIELADREIAFGDKIDAGTRFEAIYLRTLAFNNVFSEKGADSKDQCTKERAAALQGLQVLNQLQKPETLSPEDFEKNKKGPAALFNYTAGFCAAHLKDYKSAIDSYKAALAANPDDAVTYFRLGVAYLQSDPPQHMDGFWALARSVGLRKGPGEDPVRAYLRKQLYNYQLPACDKLLDAEMNELLSLAASSPERPATYKFPSSADLQKAREETTNFITDLKADGDKAKLIWLATCGLEFPEVVGKVIEVSPTENGAVLKLYNGTTQDEIEKATTPNMEVKVEGQPDAKRVQKDDPVRFSAVLMAYDPDPFLLHWEKGKINPEDIPEHKAAPGKRPVRRPTRKPGT